jgi:RNA polymerase sigma factor (sigma-70 family)
MLPVGEHREPGHTTVEAKSVPAAIGRQPSLRHSLSLRTPLLRLQSDESLVALTRSGNQAAFEALVRRYQPRLLTFCAHMLGAIGGRDAEDAVQESFVAAYTAMIADERQIEVRPWLYRIARNRCLNQLRGGATATARPANGNGEVHSLERQFADGGLSAADQVGRREELRRLVGDLHDLPESQRSALILRELEAMSYKQVADAMSTTVPSVKSLLVRARLSLVDTAEGRELPCGEVRYALAQREEGVRPLDGPERAHLKACPLCADAQKRLKATSTKLAALSPVGLVPLFHRLISSKFGGGAAAGTTGGSQIGVGLSTGAGALAAKAAAVALLTATVLTGAGPHVGAPAPAAPPSAPGATPVEPPATAAPALSASRVAVGRQDAQVSPPPAPSSPPVSDAAPAQVMSPTSTPDGSQAASVTTPSSPSDSDSAVAARGRPSPIGDESAPRGRPAPEPPAGSPPSPEASDSPLTDPPVASGDPVAPPSAGDPPPPSG